MNLYSNKLVRFSETPFYNLMQGRIQRVLIVCSDYDSFTLEVEGRIEEQIFNEYVSLNLSNSPRFKHVNTAKKALKELYMGYYDLVITMLNVGKDLDAFEFAKKIKEKHPEKPVVVLTPFSREVSLMIKTADLSGIDYVFSWLGSADVILAIIKLLEDKMNVDTDIKYGVQIILLVEDSKRYYSEYLTHMYKTLLAQSKQFMMEGLNDHQQMQRMRGRPKILLAENYEEANQIYQKYKTNILGVISDTKYKRNGIIDPEAGVKFLRKIKKDKKYLPLLLQSSDEKNREKAKELKVGFVHKYSDNLANDLNDFINTYFAFGPFDFRNPKTKEILKSIKNLKELQHCLFEIPNESFEYHITRNHLSKWLYARALFPLAEFLLHVTKEDFADDIDKIKHFIHDNIVNFRKSIARGVIAKFDKESYDNSLIFTKIGKGYLGGKARGLAFLDSLIKKHPELDRFNKVVIKIPTTVVLSTGIFDDFMQDNDLYSFALSKRSNDEILQKFVKSQLREEIKEQLAVFLKAISSPIAVRSSSVLEDSHYQPFAGIFSTYMLSNMADDKTNLMQLLTAIKSVYASVFYRETKAYMKVTKNLIDEEKMGIVLQKVCGNKYEDRYYPTFSGVARSVNFYPIGDEKHDEGIVNVALGMGKHIVEGRTALRFSPDHPKQILQLSSPEIALKETQKTFFSLNLSYESFVQSTNDSVNFNLHGIEQAQKDESIYDISSVYDFQFNTLKDGKMHEGKRVITFANVLKYNSFPLAEIIKEVLSICEKAMSNPVEIEFAVNLTPKSGNLKVVNLLQVRPIVKEMINDEIDFSDVKEEDLILFSETTLGHGIINGIKDIVYVKSDNFDSVNNQKIVLIIDEINRNFRKRGENYILCGPGRWGSSDPWLGIPVVWSQISEARLIVESGLKNYQVDPSQGTHFFQNLTSFKVGYFTINTFRKDGFLDLEFLKQFDAVYEDEFVRHIRFEKEMLIKIDGKNSKGVVLKPK